jgi:hypothetical protein
MKPTRCPIWGTPAQELPPMGDRRDIISPRVGEYAISGTAEAILRSQPLSDQEKARLTDWIADEWRKGRSPLVTTHVLKAMIGKG